MTSRLYKRRPQYEARRERRRICSNCCSSCDVDLGGVFERANWRIGKPQELAFRIADRRGHRLPSGKMVEGSIGLFEPSGITAGFQVAATMLELRLAMASGGKAFCTMTGDVGSVQAPMAAARQVVSEAGVLVNAVILSRPHPLVYREAV